MIMADVFKILFPLLGTLAALVCYWLLFEALFPQTVDRTRVQYRNHPIKIFLLGVLISIPAIMLAGWLANNAGAGGKLLGASAFVFLLASALVGSAGLARHIGCSLDSVTDKEQPWRRVLRGAVILAITFLLPLVGWFVILPATLLSGVGALALSFRKTAGSGDNGSIAEA